MPLDRFMDLSLFLIRSKLTQALSDQEDSLIGL